MYVLSSISSQYLCQTSYFSGFLQNIFLLKLYALKKQNILAEVLYKHLWLLWSYKESQKGKKSIERYNCHCFLYRECWSHSHTHSAMQMIANYCAAKMQSTTTIPEGFS